MITLYGFGRNFGLPDPSPFVTKAEVLLKMSGLTYQRDDTGFNKAPKGKLPYIDDNGTIIADSTFIRWHLEQRHGIEFDHQLSSRQKAVGWAAEKMCENHLYWALFDSRWMVDANFDKGPRRFFDSAPAVLRPLVIGWVRRSVGRALKAHGIGRHDRSDIERLAIADLDAMAALLDGQDWLGGSTPCGADATLWAFVNSVLIPHFESPIRTAAERLPALVAYRDRGLARWFPELASTPR